MNVKKSVNRSAKLTKAEKLDLISNLYVPRFEETELFDQLERCLRRGQLATQPTCLMVTGESGVGKTSLLRGFTEQFPLTYSSGQVERQVLFVSVPGVLTVVSLLKSFLVALDAPITTKGTASVLAEQVIRLLMAQKVQLVAVDEFQNLLAVDRKVLVRVLAMFKEIVNSTGVPFVFAGLPFSKRLLGLDPQFARLCQPVEVRGYNPRTGSGFVAFRRWLRAIDGALPFDGHLRIADTAFATEMFAATRGNPALVMRLIRELCFAAIEAGRDMPSQKDINAGFRSVGFERKEPHGTERLTGPSRISLPRKVSHAPALANGHKLKRGLLEAFVGWVKTTCRKSA